ncbi:NYN domain-containing protein [Mycoplasmopsis synoviae]|uniref:NYN domain-containing protein n=1 Tax=Mycoplasmopsis synoviae (strain 53) TaxID=262723 RepID=Q4A5M2_MYCS5|nr:NYN domain-containing protein [Mycoplasmopsis synoviae]AAZ43949.2 conserved hypothetical protein [Mycoplasmopsis synoviae 53]
MLNQRPNIALIIDYENYKSEKSIISLIKGLKFRGNLAIAKLITSDKSQINNKFHELEIVYQQKYIDGKSTADPRLIIETMQILYEKDIDIFCIATSDSDFVYLLQKLKSKNKYVILACESVASPWLKENAHEVFEENPIDTNKDLETNINENYLLDLLEEKIAPEKQLVVQEAQISNNENQAEKKNSRRRKRNRKKLKKANVNEITSEVQKAVLVENSETQNTETEKVEEVKNKEIIVDDSKKLFKSRGQFFNFVTQFVKQESEEEKIKLESLENKLKDSKDLLQTFFKTDNLEKILKTKYKNSFWLRKENKTVFLSAINGKAINNFVINYVKNTTNPKLSRLQNSLKTTFKNFDLKKRTSYSRWKTYLESINIIDSGNKLNFKK